MLPDEYLEYLQRNTSALERLGDRFSTSDERLNYVVTQLDKVLSGGIPTEVKDNLVKLKESVDILVSTLEERNAVVGETTQVNFRETITSLEGDRFEKECPFDGIITSACFHFPPGCNALVDIAIGHSDTQSFPREGAIALDSASPVFPVNEVVSEGEILWTEIKNGDSANSHTVSVILTLQRRL